MATSAMQETPFIKQLAANDRPTRDAALLSLRTYLTAQRTLPPSTLLKIHKALFYTLWMSDRPRPQATLCLDLASLAFQLPDSSIMAYLEAFWVTMAREWTSIDVLRMEKFLLLVRRMVGAGWEFLKSRDWDEGVMAGLVRVLREGPLEPGDGRRPNGLRYHVLDVYVDELERVGLCEGGEEGILECLLEPLRRLAEESPTKDVRRKSKEALMDERLPGNSKAIDMENQVADEEWEGITD